MTHNVVVRSLTVIICIPFLLAFCKPKADNFGSTEETALNYLVDSLLIGGGMQRQFSSLDATDERYADIDDSRLYLNPRTCGVTDPSYLWQNKIGQQAHNITPEEYQSIEQKVKTEDLNNHIALTKTILLDTITWKQFALDSQPKAIFINVNNSLPFSGSERCVVEVNLVFQQELSEGIIHSVYLYLDDNCKNVTSWQHTEGITFEKNTFCS